MTTLTNSVPTFEIFRADGSRVPTLKKSFLVKEYIPLACVAAQRIALVDGTVWKLLVEDEVRQTIIRDTQRRTAFCIVSYQVHTYGNYAIARLVKDKDTKNLTTADIQQLEGNIQ